MDALLARRAEQQAGEATVAARAHDQEIGGGRLVEEHRESQAGPGVDIVLDDDGRLDLALVVEKRDDCCIGYAASADRHTYFRYVRGELGLIDPDGPDAELEDIALRFVEEWIWYDEEEAALERVRYAGYGFPVRGANLKSEKLAELRRSGGRFSSLDALGREARERLIEKWLKQA